MVSESAHRYKHTVNLWCMPFAIKYIENSYIYVAGCRNVDTIDIAPNGDMLLCDVLDIVITDVRKRSLSEALKIFENHPLVKKLSQPVKKEPCKNCYVREFCMGGCYARAFKVYGNFNEKDPMCGWHEKIFIKIYYAGIAQVVEHQLPKLVVAGSSPVARSIVTLKSTFGKIWYKIFFLTWKYWGQNYNEM